jgi:hypothetical protein
MASEQTVGVAVLGVVAVLVILPGGIRLRWRARAWHPNLLFSRLFVEPPVKPSRLFSARPSMSEGFERQTLEWFAQSVRVSIKISNDRFSHLLPRDTVWNA